jgi:hypothetical protein
VYVEIDGRQLRVPGEAMYEGPIHFVIYPRYMTQWVDGTLLDETTRDEIIPAVIAEAASRGWRFETDDV